MELDSRYRVYRNENQIIVVTHYRGKPVRGIAKCSPKDKFNLDRGIQIAKCRCNLKLLRKKQKNDIEQYVELRRAYLDITDKLESIPQKLLTRVNEMEHIENLLSELTRA